MGPDHPDVGWRLGNLGLVLLQLQVLVAIVVPCSAMVALGLPKQRVRVRRVQGRAR